MKFAFLFPGQGSQSVGMMQGFEDQTVIRETFAEASDVLGQDFWRMVAEPNEALNQTVNTQPLMLTAGIAVWRAWQRAGGASPAVMAGHSLGEYTALVAAGAISFTDALPLVRYRAQVMQGAVAEGLGAMAAILGLDDDAVHAVCDESSQDEVLEPVNFNAPGQVVIAGHKAAVERAMEAAKAHGAKKAVLLPVSVPSHCALMKPAAEKLRDYLQQVSIGMPQIPVLHNADVASYNEAATIRDALVRQLYSPVRWVETIRKLEADGVSATVECGPGKVLAGLNKRITANVPCLALTDSAALKEAKTRIDQSE
ncbi:MAG: ACP S-malonyltransferase [Methylophilaceae bacterium]|nr:ACP S-malonyltransferase [Methylophilaceae bacterium]